MGAMSFCLFVAAMVAYAFSLNQKIKTLELAIENERLTRKYNDIVIEHKLENHIFNRHKEWTPVSNGGSMMNVETEEMVRKIVSQNSTKKELK